MLWFSDEASGLLFALGLSAFITVVVAVFLIGRKTRPLIKLLIGLAATFLFSCSLGVLISNFMVHETQMTIIAPEVQAALDKTCGESKFTAIEGEFYLDSGFHWRSLDHFAQCSEYQEGWVCSCSTK